MFTVHRMDARLLAIAQKMAPLIAEAVASASAAAPQPGSGLPARSGSSTGGGSSGSSAAAVQLGRQASGASAGTSGRRSSGGSSSSAPPLDPKKAERADKLKTKVRYSLWVRVQRSWSCCRDDVVSIIVIQHL